MHCMLFWANCVFLFSCHVFNKSQFLLSIPLSVVYNIYIIYIYRFILNYRWDTLLQLSVLSVVWKYVSAFKVAGEGWLVEERVGWGGGGGGGGSAEEFVKVCVLLLSARCFANTEQAGTGWRGLWLCGAITEDLGLGSFLNCSVSDSPHPMYCTLLWTRQ